MGDNQIEERLLLLEEEIAKIKERNIKVSIDKAWETSKFRIFAICFLTWVIISSVFFILEVERYLINAVIPVLGFYLSTQTLPIVKNYWTSKYNNNKI